MRWSGTIRDAAVGAPGSVATGVGRAMSDNAINPGLAGVPVDNRGWLFNGIAVGTGVLGMVLGATTGNSTWYEATEGVLQSGLAYASQDATHEVLRMVNKSASGTTVPKTVLQVQQPKFLPVPQFASDQTEY